MRGGTENIYGIIGMAKALDLAYQNKSSRKAYILELRQYFKEQLIQYIGDVQFNGVQEFLYTALNVSFPASDKSSLLLLQLDIAGIRCFRRSSACSSEAEKGSHVLEAIGADPKRKSIRFSLSGLNTKGDEYRSPKACQDSGSACEGDGLIYDATMLRRYDATTL